ncbi:MAG: GTP-binding DUF697 domain-containing protein [Lachnospiraceae bacterium]|nr:GTP-binding DUF697 domain-containing protein [Lachnospiraceae bacterium]
MDIGNVLVIGNSGVGKSTLINAVLGKDCARTGWGTKGTTTHLEIYTNSKLPFRLVDTVGFEPSFIKKFKAVDAIKKWSKEGTKEGNTENKINLIWFCIDGTSRKLFSDSIKTLTSATAMWKSVPIIVVITKSYSVPERVDNIRMVNDAFEKQRAGKNLKAVIPVVAKTFVINEDAFASPDGIEELVEKTNELMPLGIQAAEQDIDSFLLGRKRALAHSIAVAATTSGAVTTAVTLPITDAVILSGIEYAEVRAIAQVYGIKKDNRSVDFISEIVKAGTVSTAARGLISALKAVPGINIAAGTLNGIIAAVFVFAIGEGSVYAFEQVYLGKRSLSDLTWIRQFMEEKLSEETAGRITDALSAINDSMEIADIIKIVIGAMTRKKK